MAMSNRLMNGHSGRLARLGLSPRQQELNRLWALYRCANYDARKVDWDGRQRMDPIEHEAIATAGFIPPGFYDAGQTFPLKFRRPTAPYPLAKVIVDRFTGLLFSERRHPQPRVEGDELTEDFVQALSEAARLWQKMIMVRTYGGATGSACIGFKFQSGKPVIEVVDPRWVTADFKDRHTLEINAIEIRYMYPEDELVDGKWEKVNYWYRRVIDDRLDTVWHPQLVGKPGEEFEPNWQDEDTVREQVEHGFGFCPWRWVQNLPVVDDIDGDPDCHGLFDMFEAIDAEISQAHRGTVYNSDPTLHIGTDLPFNEIQKGSDNAIKTEKGGEAKYIEMSGSGAKAAVDLAEKMRAYALEVAQCVLEHPDTAVKTATEVDRSYSSMLAKADILREQYGQKCVIPILEMMVKGAKKIMVFAAVNEEGLIERKGLDLPDRITKRPDGSIDRAQRKLGPGGALTLQWPRYFDPNPSDVETATRSAGEAKALGLIDQEHASKYVAEYYHVDDVSGMLAKAKQEKADEQDRLAVSSLGRLNAGAALGAEEQEDTGEDLRGGERR